MLFFWSARASRVQERSNGKEATQIFALKTSPSFLWVLSISQTQLESTSSQKFHPDMRADRAAASSLLSGVLHKEVLHHTAAATRVLESDYRTETFLQHLFIQAHWSGLDVVITSPLCCNPCSLSVLQEIQIGGISKRQSLGKWIEEVTRDTVKEEHAGNFVCHHNKASQCFEVYSCFIIGWWVERKMLLVHFWMLADALLLSRVMKMHSDWSKSCLYKQRTSINMSGFQSIFLYIYRWEYIMYIYMIIYDTSTCYQHFILL